MPLSPDEFHAHALRAADSDGRLPLSRMAYWEIFPFDPDGLQTVALEPPALPEQPRFGENPADCGSCRARDEGIWLDDNWRLTRSENAGLPLVLVVHPKAHHDLADLPDDLAADLGRLTVHLTRAVEALPHIARAHVYRIGDGGAHLHVWILARPEGQAQLRGSCLPMWDDLLPEYPDDVAAADAAIVAKALAASYGGTAL